jgi:short chain dehydrogenase
MPLPLSSCGRFFWSSINTCAPTFSRNSLISRQFLTTTSWLPHQYLFCTYKHPRRSNTSPPFRPFATTTSLTTTAMADSAMKGGSFAHNNTAAPSETKVMPLFSLKGRTAIVSGAGAGIGLAVAQGFAEAGANVAIWYNSNKKAIDRAADIEKEYGVRCKKPLQLVPPPQLQTDPTLNLQAKPTRSTSKTPPKSKKP